MSLESVIEENTKALRELAAVMKGAGRAPKAEKPAAPADELADAPAHIAAAAKKAPGKAASAKPAPKAAPKVEYETLAKAVIELGKKDRETAVEILSDFGVSTARELAPEQYAEAYDLVSKALKSAAPADSSEELA